MKALKQHYMETEEGHENCPTDMTSDEVRIKLVVLLDFLQLLHT